MHTTTVLPASSGSAARDVCEWYDGVDGMNALVWARIETVYRRVNDFIGRGFQFLVGEGKEGEGREERGEGGKEERLL